MRLIVPIFAAVMSACGPAPGYEAEAPRAGDSPAERRSGTGSVVGAGTEVASIDGTPGAGIETTPTAPVQEPPEPPCARAERWLARARTLGSEGWVRRPTRLLEFAVASCPSIDVADLKGRLDQAAAPTGDRASLERQLTAALAGGAVAEARGLSARWLSHVKTQLGAEPHLVRRPAGRVVGVSSDASWVVVASDHGKPSRLSTITVLAGASGAPSHVIEAGVYVTAAEVMGDQLLTVSRDGLQLWSLATGKRAQTLAWTNERYAWARALPGGKQVIAVGEQRFAGVVRLFDAATGNSVNTLQPKGRRQLTGGVLIDGRHLLTATRDEALVIDIRRMTVIRALSTKAPDAKRAPGITSLAATSAGRLAVATNDGQIHIWDGLGATLVTQLAVGERRARVAFTAGGSQLLLATGFGFSHELRSYEIGKDKPIRSRATAGEIAFLNADGKHLLVGRRGVAPVLETVEGKALWPATAVPSELKAVALSRGLVVSRERYRRGADSEVVLDAWYQGRRAQLTREGYQANVVGISPSGRRVAAVTGSEGVVWDVESGQASVLPATGARGFPELLVFEGEARLRAMHERPATTHATDLPFSGWQHGLNDVGLSGFRGAAMSIQGAAAIMDEGVVTLAPDRVLVPSAGGAMAFSGDGSRLFAAEDERLVWFDAKGKRLGEVMLGCRPRRLAVDRSGSVAALACRGRVMTFRPPSTLATFVDPEDGYQSIEALHLSPDGRLVLLQQKTRLRFVGSDDRKVKATLEFVGGKPLATSSDHLVWYDDAAAWREQVACRIGHRAYPYAWCEDALLDDSLMDRLLVP
jgi:sugar lactone lactonase YvrE